MVMIRCALCGKKIKRRKALKWQEIQGIHFGDYEEERISTFYFCSREHMLAWVFLEHLNFFFGDIEETEKHLRELHHWDDKTIAIAKKVLKNMNIL